MRYVAVGLGLLAVTGCAQDSKWNFLRRTPDNARVAVENPTQAELVAYLNRNAQQIQSIQCSMISMDTRMNGTPFNIPGRMVCQKPLNFRLVAETLGSLVFLVWVCSSSRTLFFGAELLQARSTRYE